MIRVAVSVEGQTEEEFVKQVLAEHFRRNGAELTPIQLGKARGGAGGGNVSAPRLAVEIANLSYNFDIVTSLVDFYGFQGKGRRTVDELEALIAEQARNRLGEDWRENKVIPYVQRHEFEGLLFSDLDAFEAVLGVPQQSARELRAARAGFATPEDINDGRSTAPSKRIVQCIPS